LGHDWHAKPEWVFQLGHLSGWFAKSPPSGSSSQSWAALAVVEDQADSFSRPLRLRAAKMARPARVRIRWRKPWVRLRRRLLGWNVRLLTGKLPQIGLVTGSLRP
jgi:hypothetical protein